MSAAASRKPPARAAWRVLRERTVFASRPWIRVSTQHVRLPDGREIHDYPRIRFPDYVAVLPLTPQGRVLMLRAYRHGFHRVCLSLPGGKVEPRERPATAARRELLEETGHAARAWTALGGYMPHANYGGSTTHLFVARGARRVADPDGRDLEAMRVVAVRPADLPRLVRAGAIPCMSDVALLAMTGTLGSVVGGRPAGNRRPAGATRTSRRHRTCACW
jgi:ADP-ribose pyrophosphatase